MLRFELPIDTGDTRALAARRRRRVAPECRARAPSHSAGGRLPLQTYHISEECCRCCRSICETFVLQISLSLSSSSRLGQPDATFTITPTTPTTLLSVLTQKTANSVIVLPSRRQKANRGIRLGVVGRKRRSPTSPRAYSRRRPHRCRPAACPRRRRQPRRLV